jgi:hypothetical protein
MRQYAAIANRTRSLQIAKDIIRRKITAEHDADVRAPFLAVLATCKTVAAVRHIEAKSAQVWWRQWKDFEINFAKGFNPPEQWRAFQTKYIGRPTGKDRRTAATIYSAICRDASSGRP